MKAQIKELAVKLVFRYWGWMPGKWQVWAFMNDREISELRDAK